MARRSSVAFKAATCAVLAVVLVASLGLVADRGQGVLHAAGSGRAPAADPRPNIVVIMTDDQTLESMRVMPNVRDLIGAPGTTFEQHFASYPLCCPSRATYLTGQLPHNHDVFDNRLPDGGFERLRPAETLPVWLRRAGYGTVHIGKYLNGYKGKTVPPGWEYWHGLVCTYRMWGYTFKHNDAPARGRCGPTTTDPARYQTDVLRDIATDFIEHHFGDARPFFLSWAPLAPHVELGDDLDLDFRNPRPAPRHSGRFGHEPLPRPASFDEADMSDKPAFLRRGPLTGEEIADITKRYRSRLEALLAVDEAVKAIVDKLREKAILSRTVIIFTSDNGLMEGQHRIADGKIVAYDPSAHVPLLMRGPGIPVGRTVSAMVSNVDLAATVLDLADATAGIAIDGLSLLPVAQNPAAIADRHLLLETGEPGARQPGRRWYAAVRTERYLYVEHWLRNADGVDVRTGTELYDQSVDGQQLNSKHADPAYRAIMAELSRRLRTLQRCSGPDCRGLRWSVGDRTGAGMP
jgi:arylsulfatase A-like enzyme